MDPVTALGAAGSVVGIAGFGIQLYQILSKFVSQVRSAQEQLEEVIAEIDSTTSALEEIYVYLEQEVRNVETGQPLELFSESSLIKVKVTADKCLVVFWRIETAIAGSEPDGFDKELANRLTSFNRKLASYYTGRTIKIESQLTSDPLRFRDKLRWAFQSSKLEKFCKELKRYQNHLGLLLQIVLLGQQQAKQHPTKLDNIEIRHIYAFMNIATPAELRSMALEAQQDGDRRRGRGRRPASSRIRWPLDHSQIQSPTRRNSSKAIQLPGPQRPWDHISPRATNKFVSSDTETRHARTTSPLGRLPQQKIANNGSEKHALDRSAQRQITTRNRVSDASVPSARAPNPVVIGEGTTTDQGAKGSQSTTIPSRHDVYEKPALGPPKRGSAVLQGPRFPVQNVTGRSGIEIVPYVIQEEGAYQLPISLQLARKDTSSTLSEHDTAMELAFLSPGQLQTLQRLLQYGNEAEPCKLVCLEVAKRPTRKFWHRQRQVTVAFVEGHISHMPRLLLLQADASSRQTNGTAYLQSAQEVNQGRPPSRIGLPEFQDVTNDLSDKMHTPWSQTSNGDRFTEYRIWHIEPYSAYDIGGESGKDWARSLLKEETLPRVEIKRRLRILDKDPATFQVWRSMEAAKLGDPDLDYQWSLRQLEIIRIRRFFMVKQVKAIIVYVSKAPLLHRDTPDPEIALSYVPHNSYDALHGNIIDTKHHTAAQRPTSSAGSALNVKSGALSAERLNNRESVGQNDAKVDGRPAAAMTNRHEQAIARANSRIASRPPIPSLTRRQTLTSADEYSEPDYELPRSYDKEREDELVRKIQRLELEIKHRGELEESERRTRTMREMQREIRSERHNEADRAEREPLSTQDIQYFTHKGREQKGHPRNRASVRLWERSRSHTPHQLTYYNNSETERPRVRYPSQFDRRRFDPRSVAESQNAVKQLLLEWTPTHMRDGDNEDGVVPAPYDEGNSTSDTGSEEYVMAEEFPTSQPSLVLQREQAKNSHSLSATELDDDPWSWKVRRKGVHGALPPVANQDFLEQDGGKAAQDDVVLRGWGTWGGRTGAISGSPQQLPRPSSINADDANGADEKSQWDVPQTSTSKEPTTQETNDGVRLFQKGKNIARASTLPQTSRQPWSDEDWARQIVEETARTAEDETGLDHLRGRRASFYFPMSRDSASGPYMRTTE
ncbi:hypothetical protein F4801DRAFT_596011 [Xylaria longipes]|nr:hypothetical protein F4801DRAFT_596011 [Xylaria longipes]